MRETMPNRMLIIETLPRSSSTDFAKIPFVRKPTLLRESKSQRVRNPSKPTNYQQIPQIIDPLSPKRRPSKITTSRVSADDSRILETRPIKITPLEKSSSHSQGLSIGSHQHVNVRKNSLKQGVPKFNCLHFLESNYEFIIIQFPFPPHCSQNSIY